MIKRLLILVTLGVWFFPVRAPVNTISLSAEQFQTHQRIFPTSAERNEELESEILYERSKKSKGDFESPFDFGNYIPAVKLTTINLGNKIEIRIRDDGLGIPQNIIDKIFQPFFTTKPTGQGTGLGLSLSYDIVKAHGGTIDVKTNYYPPGGEIKVNTKVDEGNPDDFGKRTGTEFIIQLPI